MGKKKKKLVGKSANKPIRHTIEHRSEWLSITYTLAAKDRKKQQHIEPFVGNIYKIFSPLGLSVHQAKDDELLPCYSLFHQVVANTDKQIDYIARRHNETGKKVRADLCVAFGIILQKLDSKSKSYPAKIAFNEFILESKPNSYPLNLSRQAMLAVKFDLYSLYKITGQADRAQQMLQVLKDSGDPLSLYLVATTFHSYQDRQEAFSYFLKAAEAGHQVAMVKSAFAYHSGHGVSMDSGKAEYWYNCAIKSLSLAEAKDDADEVTLRLVSRVNFTQHISSRETGEWFESNSPRFEYAQFLLDRGKYVKAEKQLQRVIKRTQHDLARAMLAKLYLFSKVNVGDAGQYEKELIALAETKSDGQTFVGEMVAEYSVQALMTYQLFVKNDIQSGLSWLLLYLNKKYPADQYFSPNNCIQRSLELDKQLLSFAINAALQQYISVDDWQHDEAQAYFLQLQQFKKIEQRFNTDDAFNGYAFELEAKQVFATAKRAHQQQQENFASRELAYQTMIVGIADNGEQRLSERFNKLSGLSSAAQTLGQIAQTLTLLSKIAYFLGTARDAIKNYVKNLQFIWHKLSEILKKNQYDLAADNSKHLLDIFCAIGRLPIAPTARVVQAVRYAIEAIRTGKLAQTPEDLVIIIYQLACMGLPYNVISEDVEPLLNSLWARHAELTPSQKVLLLYSIVLLEHAQSELAPESLQKILRSMTNNLLHSIKDQQEFLNGLDRKQLLLVMSHLQGKRFSAKNLLQTLQETLAENGEAKAQSSTHISKFQSQVYEAVKLIFPSATQEDIFGNFPVDIVIRVDMQVFILQVNGPTHFLYNENGQPVSHPKEHFHKAIIEETANGTVIMINYFEQLPDYKDSLQWRAYLSEKSPGLALLLQPKKENRTSSLWQQHSVPGAHADSKESAVASNSSI